MLTSGWRVHPTPSQKQNSRQCIRKMPVINESTNGQVKITLLLIPVVIVACLFFFRFAEDTKSEIITEDKNKVEQKKTVSPASQVTSGAIPEKSSLYASLCEVGIPQSLTIKITRALQPVFDLRHSSPGDSYSIEYIPPETLVRFEYSASGPDRYCVLPKGDFLVASRSQKDLDCFLRCVRGKVEGSLWKTLVGLGEDPKLISKLADTFAWEIDFLTEVRDGDEFEMIYECFEENGTFAFCGNILAARYSLHGSDHFAILYKDPEGNRDYYDLDGISLRKTLLKSPLNYKRISSKYSMSRLHPILKIRRPHYGIDYVAKTGTPVVAAGDGRVIFKGWKGEYGKTVIIRHNHGFQTCYGHLSRLAENLSNGKKVIQGQVIGYVGSTGLSTGPHLDYRVKKDGKYVDPLKLAPPSAKPVQKKFRQDFFQDRDEILSTMRSITDDKKIYVARKQKGY